MYSSQERQVSIYIRKYNLEEIGNSIVTKLLPALPYIEGQLQEQIHRTHSTLQEVRNIEREFNNSKQFQGRLIAKRTQLQRQSTEAIEMVKKLYGQTSELEELIKREQMASNLVTDQYTAKVREIINLCHQHAKVYDEDVMKGETEKQNEILSEVKSQMEILRKEVEEEKKILAAMKPDVPENILKIVGKTHLEEKLNSII